MIPKYQHSQYFPGNPLVSPQEDYADDFEVVQSQVSVIEVVSTYDAEAIGMSVSELVVMDYAHDYRVSEWSNQ